MAPSNSTTNHLTDTDKEGKGKELIPIGISMIHPWGAGQRRKAEVLENWKEQLISFPSMFNTNPSDGPVVIEARIANCLVRNVYTDTGAGADIMYEHCFIQLPKDVQERMKETYVPLASFTSEPSWSEGSIVLEVTLGKPPLRRTANIEFLVVKASSQYNVILGRTALMTFGAVTSTVHGMMKFPTPGGIATLYAERQKSIECSQVTKAIVKPLIHEDGSISPNPKFPDQKIMIGHTLSEACKQKLYTILATNLDVFAWQPSDMTGVPREVAEHRLNVNPNIHPVCQKKRGMAPERSKFLREEVRSLVDAGILREVKYQTWVANPVMVRKPDNSWRMCVDFTDINKACPKDNYPLPEIDWKVESLDGYRFKCFLDAAKGYHQIPMAVKDEDKTAFHTTEGIFCYIKMPFGLKNAGATYQRLIDKAFKDQIGRNLEAYVDDIVVKSHTEEQMLRDIQETFTSLQKINMKLNPKKCTFGVEEGKFLGHIVTERGIKANPKKIQAIEDMKSPANKKEVQRLHGCLAALTRFLSKAAEKSLPFMKVLKGCLNKKDFVWTAEAENAFQEVKQLLKKLPTLTAPRAGETLILYLAISKEAISSVLIAERNGVQMPIYFVSKVLQLSETNYPPIHRLVYALVHTARRLRRYFQGHPILVLTDQPLKQVLRRPESSGRLAKWAIELGEYEINFAPRNAVKGQILADFLLETNEKVECDNSTARQQHIWELHTDGASSEEGTGAGLVLTSPDGEEYTYALKFCFYASNNEAEYEALLSGLRIAVEMGITNLRAYVDSQIVAQQVNGTFDARDTSMKQYVKLVETISKRFDTLEVVQIPRNKNKKADVLSKLATLTFDHLHKKVLVEELKEKSIHEKPIMTIVEGVKDTWMNPYLRYLHDGWLPVDKVEARRIKVTAPMYEIVKGVLYRKSYNGPLLRCLDEDEAVKVVKEMHEGVCSQHSGYRTVASRIMRQGYFWPSLYRDVAEIIKTCENCQRHGTIQRLPKYDLIPVTSAWPFCKWAIDIVGPFSRSTGNAKFLVVAIDFFTKWVEAKALAKITGENVKKFVWHDIVCRYGVPNEIVSDNGKQFAENPFRSWCEEQGIKQSFTSVAHPQANGQVEVTNKEIVAGIKARLGLSQTGWVDELPNVLWAHRTTPKRSTGETPFSLVYGTEAVIPAEICVPTQRIMAFNVDSNSEALKENLNLLEERRLMAAIRQADHKHKMAKYYNKKVQHVQFEVGDLVLRDNEASRQIKFGKLAPKWEGPYKVTKVNQNGSYMLAAPSGEQYERAWNAMNLKKFYA